MGNLNVNKITLTDFTNDTTLNYSVTPVQTDGATGIEETEWTNTKASQYLGYYKAIPELRSVINALSLYSVGQGWIADPETAVILEHIDGWGEDTINSIFDNLIRCKKIYGDAFAEIIKDEKSGILTNLKVLDPATIRIVVNKQGRIKRYEQFEKTGKTTNVLQKFQPGELLHLCNDRIADEIHGTSIIQAVEWIILAKNEAMDDRKTIFHRNVAPLKLFYADTDDQGKMDEITRKLQIVAKDKEWMVVPMDSAKVEIPVMSIVDSEAWIKYLDNHFYEVVGVPKIITGGSQEFTEASSKIAFTTFQQVYKREQEELMADLWNKLGIRVEFNQPASLMNELITSENKNTGQTGFQPNDITIGSGQA